MGNYSFNSHRHVCFRNFFIKVKFNTSQFCRDGGGDEGVGPVHEEADGEEEADVAGVALASRLVQLTGSAVALVRQKL